MTFIDISYRLGVMATCTNRKWKIWEFGGSTSGFAKILGVHLIGHSRLVGGLFYDFYSYLLPLGRNGHLDKPEMEDLRFWGPTSGFAKIVRAHLIGHPRLLGVYFMNFIDISNRLAVMVTCTNRKWKIWDFEGPLPVLQKF